MTITNLPLQGEHRMEALRQALRPVDTSPMTVPEVVRLCEEAAPGCTFEEIILALRQVGEEHQKEAEALRSKITTDEYFGGCPLCGQSDGYRNIGRDHWFLCNTHKTKWNIGSNLFSGWRDETEATWRDNARLLEGYTEVEPIHPEPTEEDLRAREEHEAWRAEADRIDKGFGVVCGPDGMRALEPNENPFDIIGPDAA